VTHRVQPVEIERELTFLASSLPVEIENVTPKRLVDVYIPESGVDHPHLRLRQKGDTYEITKKTQIQEGDASTHHEMTIALDEKEFSALASASKKRIVKDRYLVSIDGYPAEVDVFREALEGLVLIDFEFSSEQDKQNFVAPSVCLADVTQEEFIAGGLLAGKEYDEIEPLLKNFNYRSL
jgi:CYTH domain-containing protein